MDDASDAKKRVGPTISFGSPTRPRGILDTQVCISFFGSNCGSAITSLRPGVMNWHGAMALTRIPRSAHSSASCFVIALTPPLLAQYALAPRPTPTTPAIDEKLM